MILEHAEFTLRPGVSDEFRAAVAEHRVAMLESPGCRGVRVLTAVDQPDGVLLEVEWDTLADHTEVFAASATGASLVAALVPLCAGPPRVVHYDTQTWTTTTGSNPREEPAT